jgi:enoyl-CoA hydratase/carnithine racemase
LASVQDLTIDPQRLTRAWVDDVPPLGLVDLVAVPVGLRLPPFPLIGLGDPEHPAAQLVDAIVETPASVRKLIERIECRPHASAVLVDLLRGIEGMPVDRALTAESLAYGLLQCGAEHAAWLASQTARPAPPGRLIVARKDSVLRIVIDRPDARNAINRDLRDGLYEAFSLAALDPEIKCVELRSTGPAFSVGADLSEFGTTRDPAIAHQIRSRTLPAHPISQRAEIVDVHIQGACIGSGLEMAAFAGHVTASSGAWFQLPELAMGLIPGAGGCVSVSRRIGRQRTALMILSGQRIKAATALAWGLIDGIEARPPVVSHRPRSD